MNSVIAGPRTSAVLLAAVLEAICRQLNLLGRLARKHIAILAAALLVCPAVRAETGRAPARTAQRVIELPLRGYQEWPSEPSKDCPFERSKALSGSVFTGAPSDGRVDDTSYPSWAADGKPCNLGLSEIGVFAAGAAGPQTRGPAPTRYILLNVHSPTRQVLDEIRAAVPAPARSELRVGFSFIVSYLAREDQATIAHLKNGLDLARETAMPVFIWLDGEYWWQHRPDLWNWWDPEKPGYDPTNKQNVEWFSWNPDDALKISWLNWGRQIRMLPPPNLMSPRYRAACHEKMRLLVPIILDWWQALPVDQKHLLAGVKVGWESSIGVNNFYYPNGNALLDKPADADPKHGIKATEVPARGLVQLGYAAVKTAGIRTAGQITEADLAEVARRHMEDLARLAADLGVPRDRLYTHGAGWKEKERLYGAAVNKFSCPGWSFYRHAGDPSKDAGVQEALARSDAPHWGAVEWLYQGPRTVDAWRGALEKTLADPRCRLICIVNWSSIKEDAPAHAALRQVTEDGR